MANAQLAIALCNAKQTIDADLLIFKQVLLPMLNVRGNYTRIRAALSRLRELGDQVNNSMVCDRSRLTNQDHLDGIQLGLQAAVDMFQRQVATPLQVLFLC